MDLMDCMMKLYDSIYNRIRYLVRVKSDITYVLFPNYAKIKVESYDSLPLVKILTFHNIIILIKSVFNKDKKKKYYQNVFLGKGSNK